MRVLVVEDESLLADAIAEWLRREAFAVDVVYDGGSALERLGVNEYDVVVLDRDLPVVHGDRVCRAVAGSGPRVLMLTAAADVDDRIDGLELGADDYLGKPFVFAELVARVRALSRRAPSAPPVLRHGDLTVDRARHRASRGSRPLPLTRKEFGVLETLMAADGVAAFDFYAGMFGWTKDMAVDMGPMGVYQTFAQDGVQAGGIMTKPPGTPGGPTWCY